VSSSHCSDGSRNGVFSNLNIILSFSQCESYSTEELT
jgi:hypothetical protein